MGDEIKVVEIEESAEARVVRNGWVIAVCSCRGWPQVRDDAHEIAAALSEREALREEVERLRASRSSEESDLERKAWEYYVHNSRWLADEGPIEGVDMASFVWAESWIKERDRRRKEASDG